VALPGTRLIAVTVVIMPRAFLVKPEKAQCDSNREDLRKSSMSSAATEDELVLENEREIRRVSLVSKQTQNKTDTERRCCAIVTSLVDRQQGGRESDSKNSWTNNAVSTDCYTREDEATSLSLRPQQLHKSEVTYSKQSVFNVPHSTSRLCDRLMVMLPATSQEWSHQSNSVADDVISSSNAPMNYTCRRSLSPFSDVSTTSGRTSL
jgi:hypothetical protein